MNLSIYLFVSKMNNWTSEVDCVYCTQQTIKTTNIRYHAQGSCNRCTHLVRETNYLVFMKIVKTTLRLACTKPMESCSQRKY